MSINELLAFSKAHSKKNARIEVITTLEKSVEDFFWNLNEDIDYNEEQYGGIIQKGFHPSSLVEGIECRRELMYIYLQVEKDEPFLINPKLRKIFDNGHSVHDRWQKYFTMLARKNPDIKFLGLWRCSCFMYFNENETEDPYGKPCPSCGKKYAWKYKEVGLKNENLRLVGKRDGKLVINNSAYLLEIKSINTFQFGNLYEPLRKHLQQLNLYMMMDNIKKKKGIFLYEDKNNQEVKFFLVDYDSSIINNICNDLVEVGKYIDSQKLCNRLDSFPADYRCKICDFKKTCAEGKSFSELEKN
jgi:hypothetical protein